MMTTRLLTSTIFVIFFTTLHAHNVDHESNVDPHKAGIFIPPPADLDFHDYHPVRKGPVPDLKDMKYYSYHIHVYFLQYNRNSTEQAVTLRNGLLNLIETVSCDGECNTWCPKSCVWGVNMGPRGPHVIGNWGIYVTLEDFPKALEYVTINRGELSVLVHPNSGYPYSDHLDRGLWMPPVLPLDGAMLDWYDEEGVGMSKNNI